MSVNEFWKSAVNIREGVEASAGRSCHAWISFAMFNILRFINDPRCLKDDRTLKLVQDTAEEI